jgi:hypothetical protein
VPSSLVRCLRLHPHHLLHYAFADYTWGRLRPSSTAPRPCLQCRLCLQHTRTLAPPNTCSAASPPSLLSISDPISVAAPYPALPPASLQQPLQQSLQRPLQQPLQQSLQLSNGRSNSRSNHHSKCRSNSRSSNCSNSRSFDCIHQPSRYPLQQPLLLAAPTAAPTARCKQRSNSRSSNYTLGPGLRIPIIKNMGKALALEELRICPWPRARRS